MEPTTKRFRIAFSFAGERRDFVAQVAAILARRFGEDAILYDKYQEAEFARHDLGRMRKLTSSVWKADDGNQTELRRARCRLRSSADS